MCFSSTGECGVSVLVPVVSVIGAVVTVGNCQCCGCLAADLICGKDAEVIAVLILAWLGCMGAVVPDRKQFAVNFGLHDFCGIACQRYEVVLEDIANVVGVLDLY